MAENKLKFVEIEFRSDKIKDNFFDKSTDDNKTDHMSFKFGNQIEKTIITKLVNKAMTT